MDRREVRRNVARRHVQPGRTGVLKIIGAVLAVGFVICIPLAAPDTSQLFPGSFKAHSHRRDLWEGQGVPNVGNTSSADTESQEVRTTLTDDVSDAPDDEASDDTQTVQQTLTADELIAADEGCDEEECHQEVVLATEPSPNEMKELPHTTQTKLRTERSVSGDMKHVQNQRQSWAYRKAHRKGDLARLPDTRAPDGPEWTNSIAICAIMKQENTTDVREWLLYHRGVSLGEFLDRYKHEAGLVMHWVLFGPGGHKTRPEHGGVLREYTQCGNDANAVYKSIANTWFLANIAGHPHAFEYRDDMRAINELRNPIPWRMHPHCTSLSEAASYEDVVACRPYPHVQTFDKSAKHIALFHYVTRSEQDFQLKQARGGGGGSHRTWQYFQGIEREASDRGGVCEEAAAVAEECCPVDQYVLHGPGLDHAPAPLHSDE